MVLGLDSLRSGTFHAHLAKQMNCLKYYVCHYYQPIGPNLCKIAYFMIMTFLPEFGNPNHGTHGTGSHQLSPRNLTDTQHTRPSVVSIQHTIEATIYITKNKPGFSYQISSNPC